MSATYTNSLVNEKSPYLLQHAHNPVDWRPWGAEVFAAAVEQQKPLFVSIGYSTCHWCHVMERESFEDEDTAKLLNENFICVKVDREERPDVDEVYMTAVTAMTGGGGWPLSVFLTPEGKPFFGGTYFPPRDSHGMPAFGKVLASVIAAWRDNHGDILESAEKISRNLREMTPKGETGRPSHEMLERAAGLFEQVFDHAQGGFGDAPKFPQPSTLAMLLAWHSRTGGDSLDMVKRTLDAMAAGGIHDHLGGGFHRYSVDAAWAVPHFEKMLYDQALIARVCVATWQLTGDREYASLARETLDYVLRDMTDAGGGFYSGQDADSEGREGTFYTWPQEEIRALLGQTRADVFCDYYGVTSQGNFEDGRSILRRETAAGDVSDKYHLGMTELLRMMAESRARLLKARQKRTAPHTDDKVITAWNGLMIGALAYAGAAMGEDRYIAAAARAARFTGENLLQDGRLMRYWRDGAAEKGFLDDYASLAAGMAYLYEADLRPEWLAMSRDICKKMLVLFDDGNGGLSYSATDSERLFIDPSSTYDGAIPSAISLAAKALLRVGMLTRDGELTSKAEQILKSHAASMLQSPGSHTALVCAADLALGPSMEILVAGQRDDENVKRFIDIVHRSFLPRAVLLLHEPGNQGKPVEDIVPQIATMGMVGDKPAAYLCSGFVCQKPVTEPLELASALEQEQRKSRQ
jgi:uncharacterized protein